MKSMRLLLCIVSLLFASGIRAAETEPNNSKADANTLTLNGSNSGAINVAGDEDWYKLTTNADGKINVTIAVSNGLTLYCYLYDNNGTTLLNSAYSSVSTTVSYDGAAAGTYYVKLVAYYSAQLPAYTISNTLTLPAVANDAEPNNNRAQALTLSLNGSKTGHVGYYYNLQRDTADWYKVTTNADGLLRVTATPSNGQTIYLYLYDNDGSTLLKSVYSASSASLDEDGLAAGTYYVKVNSYYSSQFEPYTLSNNLILPLQANDAEPNDSRAQALNLPVNSSKTGHVGYYYNLQRDTTDWYKVTTTADGSLRLSVVPSNGQTTYLYLYDNDGTTLLNSVYSSTNATLNEDGLAVGTYYAKVRSYYSSQFQPYTITDSLFAYSYANDAEPNAKPYQAKTIAANSSTDGHVGFLYNNNRDTTDWWKVNYTGSGTLSFTINQETLKGGGTYTLYFQVYKDTAASPIHSSYSSAASRTVSLTALTQGYYYIKVFSYYSSQHSSYSFTNSFTQVNIASVSITSAVNGGCSAGQLQLQCSGSQPPYTVKLYRFGNLYKTYTINQAGSSTISALPAGTYYATSFGDGATGTAFGTSNSKNLLPPATTTSGETNITATAATVRYVKVSCANGYYIQYRKQGVTAWTSKILMGNKDSLRLTALTAGTTYEWRVAVGVGTDSISNYVLSAFSAVDQFTTASTLIAFTVVPNPATTQFTIQLGAMKNEKVSAWLKDAAGNIYWTVLNVNLSSLNVRSVAVSHLKPGLYYLQLDNASGTTVQKIVVGPVKLYYSL